MLSVCQLVGHRLVMPLLLRPQLVMHWLVMHALAKDSPGWPGDVSVTDLPCVHAIYMEYHRRQTTDSCKKLMVSVCETTPFSFSPLRHRASLGVILAPSAILDLWKEVPVLNDRGFAWTSPPCCMDWLAPLFAWTGPPPVFGGNILHTLCIDGVF